MPGAPEEPIELVAIPAGRCARTSGAARAVSRRRSSYSSLFGYPVDAPGVIEREAGRQAGSTTLRVRAPRSTSADPRRRRPSVCGWSWSGR